MRRVVPLPRARRRHGFPVEEPRWDSWWRGLRARASQSSSMDRPRFSTSKAKQLIKFSASTSTLQQLAILLRFPLPALLAALVAPLIPLQDPSRGALENRGFCGHIFVIIAFNMAGAMLEMRAVAGIAHSEYTNSEIALAAVLGALQMTVFDTWLGVAWRFPVPFMWIVCTLPWVVCLVWTNLLVLRSRLWRRSRMRTRLLFSVPQLAVQLAQIALYPAYSALFEIANQWQQLVLIACFPLLKVVLKQMVFAVSHHLSDYARETAVSGVEISASMYQSMILQNTPSLMATALVILVDVVQGVVDVRRFMETHAVVPTGELLAGAMRILENHRDGIPDVSTRPSVVLWPAKLPRRTEPSVETVAKNKLVLTQALEMLQSAETILLIEYLEVAVPITNALFVCGASQLQSAMYNPKLRPFHDDPTTLRVALGNVMLYTALQAVTLAAMALVMRVRYRVSALALLAFVLDHHAWSLHGKMIAWLTSILEFSVLHYGVDFTFKFDFTVESKPVA